MSFKKILLSLFLLGFTALPAMAEKKISVLPFDVLTQREDMKQFGVGTMDSLTTALSNIPEFIMVDRGQLNTILKEQAFQKSGFSDDKETTEIGKLVGADILVMGSIQSFDNEYRINAHFTEVKTGKILRTVLVTGNNIFKLQDQLASELIAQQEIKISTEQQQLITSTIKATDNTTAYDYYIKGQTEFLNYNIDGYKSAIEFFDKALEVDPNYTLAISSKSEVQSYLSNEYRFSGMEYKGLLKQAKENALLALSKDEKLGDVHLALSIINSIEGNNDLSKEEARKAIELNPNEARAYTMLWIADFFNAKNKFKVDVDAPLLVKSLKINPNLLDTHLYLVSGYLAKPDAENAIKEAEICVKIAPKSSYTHLMLANALALKNKDEGLKEYNIALELNPNNSIILMTVGSIYASTGKYDEAIDKLDASLKAFPDNASIYFILSGVYIKKNQYPEAEISLKKAISLSPVLKENVFTHYSLGQILQKQEKNDEAISEFKLALKIDPGMYKNHYYLGKSYQTQNKYDEAIAEFKQLPNYNTDKTVLAGLGDCYLNLSTKMYQDGKIDDAIVNYQEAEKFNPKSVDVHINLGAAYYSKKDFEKSVAEYLEAIKLKPENADAHYNLGITYDALQKKDLALAEYSSACKLGIKSACN